MGKAGYPVAPVKRPPVPHWVWLQQRFRLQLLAMPTAAARSTTAALSTTAATAAPGIKMRRVVSDPVVAKDSTLTVDELLDGLRARQRRSKSCPPKVAGRLVQEVDV